MPFFRVFTNLNLNNNNNNLHTFISKAVSVIVNVSGEKSEHVALYLNQVKKLDDNEADQTECEIITFNKPTVDVKNSLQQAALKFEVLLKKWCDIVEHEFTITFSDYKYVDYKERVLVDWTRRRSFIASTPIQNQRFTSACWAYAIADVVGTNYAIKHLAVRSYKEFRCSPQDLTDWVYSVKELEKKPGKKKKEIDQYGTYPCNSDDATSFVREFGVSLLHNYRDRIENKKIQIHRDDRKFRAMHIDKGPRIFVKHWASLETDDNTDVLNIETVVKFLTKGVVYATMYFCKGCPVCGKGFSSFDGNGVYDEPSHPPNHVFESHAVMVVGVGNTNGKDYLTIRNSHGYNFAKKGYANVHIKFFVEMYLPMELEKKEWNGKEWVSEV